MSFRTASSRPAILLVGSSIFEAWKRLEDFGDGAEIVNRAVGGTVTSYWAEHIERIAADEKPDLVYYYCGSNDINAMVSEEKIVANTLLARERLHRAAPTARFIYFHIIKAPQKYGRWDMIDRINAAVEASLSDGDNCVATNLLFFRNGTPVDSYFLDDGLHLRPEAYAALNESVKNGQASRDARAGSDER